VQVNVQKNAISLSQQEINTQLMTGLNPYLLQETKLDELKLKKTSEITTTTQISEGIQGSLITGLILLILGVIGILAQRRKIKKTQEAKQEESVAEQIRYIP
jgi:hypothetical protein